MPRQKMPSARTRVTHARRIALQAQVDATATQNGLGGSRSTRTRHAYKTKADALDRIVRILSGKERL